MDLYRLEQESELEQLGFDDYISVVIYALSNGQSWLQNTLKDFVIFQH